MNIVIRTLTPDLADDFFTFFEQTAYTEHEEWGRECYCCFFHAESAEAWERRTGPENRMIAQEMIRRGKMTGLLAYADGVPAGWCHFDAKGAFPGIGVFYPQLASDEPGVGAVVCFTVAQRFRRMGIARLLLRRACEELRRMGFAAAEGYPVGKDESDEENYHGPLGLYLSEGFTVYRKLEKGAVVRKELL